MLISSAVASTSRRPAARHSSPSWPARFKRSGRFAPASGSSGPATSQKSALISMPCRSQVHAATVPPRRVTRRSSRAALPASGMNWKTRSDSAQSNDAGG